MIKGQLTKSETNQWGFTTVWVSGTRYGSDKKGTYPAQVGDIVEFEAYEKQGTGANSNRTWPTVKFESFRKSASVPAAPTGSVGTTERSVAPGKPASNAVGGRDAYWAEKEARDIVKEKRYQERTEPKLDYFAALERAISFVDLALRNGAIGAYEKAKATGKLEVLTALVYETTQRIIAESYAQTVPAPGVSKDLPELTSDLPEKAQEELEESWA